MEKQTVRELKALSKERGIPKYYRMRKAELIEALGKLEAMTPLPNPSAPQVPNTNILDET